LAMLDAGACMRARMFVYACVCVLVGM